MFQTSMHQYIAFAVNVYYIVGNLCNLYVDVLVATSALCVCVHRGRMVANQKVKFMLLLMYLSSGSPFTTEQSISDALHHPVLDIYVSKRES